MTTDRLVKLNVGGVVFKTSVSTLCKHDSMLKTMFTTDVPISIDEDGCVFIDRDPRHFHVILNFLRDGWVALPESSRELKELLAGSSFFLLDPLTEQCEEVLANSISGQSYHVATTTLESRKFIFGSEKPVIMLQLPANIGTRSGTTNYYFSEQKFLELSDNYHKLITFVLVTEPHFNEDCWWRFFLKTKTRGARIKGDVDGNLVEACLGEMIDEIKQGIWARSRLID